MQPQPPPLDLSALVAGRAPTEHEKEVWATRTGIQLLVLAILLQWIPLIEYLGLMVGAIGILYVVRGRRVFGPRQERLIWASVILFVAAEVAAFALDQEFGYALTVARYASSGTEAASAAVAAYSGMAVGASVVAAALAACYVLLTLELEDREGRWILLAGLAAQVAVSAALCAWVFLPAIQASVPQAYLANPPDAALLAAADALIRGASPIRLFDLIPAILIAWAYWRVVLRINRNEIPPAQGVGTSSGPL